MPRNRDIEGLAWTEEDERHVEEHIDSWEIEELIEGRDFSVFRNTTGHPPNRWRIIGRTPSGWFVTAILEEPPDGDPTRWRPVTGWRSTPFERDMYNQERTRMAKKQGKSMAKKTTKVNANPLAPALTRADWEAQGWATESEPLKTAPRLEATISIRFDPDGALLLRKAARLKGFTKSEFVRQATLQEAQKVIDETPLPASMWVRDKPTASIVIQGREVVQRNVSSVTTRGTDLAVERVS